MDRYLNLLAENKEKILFGFALGLTLLICAFQAEWGGGLSDVRTEAYNKAVRAAGIEAAKASSVMTALEENKTPVIEPLKADRIARGFLDDRDVHTPVYSGWMIRQDKIQRLPPLRLSFPGFPDLNDFDIPAGPAPDLRLVKGTLPRDTREVTLTKIDSGEFGND